MFTTISADSPRESTRLQRQAAILARTAHPDVTELVEFRPNTTGAELDLSHPKGMTIADLPVHSLRQTTELFAAAANALAHVHQCGVVHRALDADRIIVRTSDGRPTLIGFDDAIISADGQARADDVAALGELLGRRLEATMVDSKLRLYESQLVAIVDHATHADASLRPTARRLAEQLHHLIVTFDTAAAEQGRLRRDVRGRRHGWGGFSGRRGFGRKTVVVAAVAGIATAIMLSVWQLGAGDKGDAAAVPVCPAIQIEDSSADVDGDGCQENVHLDSGRVTVNGEVYEVGAADDLMVLGRWNCTPTQQLAVIRHDSGDIYVFDTWPAQGESSTARFIKNVEDAKSVRAQDDGDCDVLSVSGDDGDQMINANANANANVDTKEDTDTESSLETSS